MIIVVPHRRVRLPHGISWEGFLADPTQYFKENE
jgi:hypothetical protein